MNARHFKTSAVRRAVVGACIAGVTLVTAVAAGPAQQSMPPVPVTDEAVAIDPARLEHTFWLCDYIATVNGVGAVPVATCSTATETLKDVKFRGDFLELLEWWRANKPAEHARLAAAGAGESAAAVDSDGVEQTHGASRHLLALMLYN